MQRERSAGRLPKDLAYTLPTEAQWEYGCRAPSAGIGQAGTRTRFHFGDSERELKNYANYEDTPRYGGERTAPVGSFRPNGRGLYDMHGNVWEWCLDWYNMDYPSGTVRDPTGPSLGSTRIVRGGSLNVSALGCRSALRNRLLPGNTGADLGFRLALSSVR